MISSGPIDIEISSIITYKALAYAWREDSFLSRPQAVYALKRLWECVNCGLEADWEGQASLIFPSLTRVQVEAMLDLPAGALPWVKLADFLPAGADLPFDADTLPALGLLDNDGPPHYEGVGLFPLDLTAAAFLLLSRWEDVYRRVSDYLDRPEETASFNFRQGFHDRPVLDEWGLVLRVWLQKARPGWWPAEANYRLWLTHDMDVPYGFKSWPKIFKIMAKHVILDHSLGHALKVPREYLMTRRDFQNDPCYQGVLDLMNFDEHLGQRGTFFFMTAQKGTFDDGYDLSVPPYSDLLRAVKSRGYEVGWHPGFAAADDESVFAAELARANDFFGLGHYGARRHYLTWPGPQAWRAMDAGGCLYDASCGYVKHIGFRVGTAHAFPAYDLHNDCCLRLVLRPLIVHDTGLYRETAFDFDAGYAKYMLVHQRTRAVGGTLSILIHNSYERLRVWMERIVLTMSIN